MDRLGKERANKQGLFKEMKKENANIGHFLTEQAIAFLTDLKNYPMRQDERNVFEDRRDILLSTIRKALIKGMEWQRSKDGK
jgi:hypothetical protein